MNYTQRGDRTGRLRTCIQVLRVPHSPVVQCLLRSLSALHSHAIWLFSYGS